METILLFMMKLGATILFTGVVGFYLMAAVGPLITLMKSKWNALWAIPYVCFMIPTALLLFVVGSNGNDGLLIWFYKEIWK